MSSAFTSLSFSDPAMAYLHPEEVPAPKVSEGGKGCTLITKRGDWWHTLDRDSQDGLAWGKWIDIKDGLEVQVKAAIKEVNRYDQACLFFYLSPHCWIKAGVEYDMGKLWDGAVVCNPYSDWAITPAFPSPTYTIAFDPKTQHIRIFLNDTMIREVHAFGSGFSDPASKESAKQGEGGHEGQVFIGIMGCSPLGERSEASFRDLEYRYGVREVV